MLLAGVALGLGSPEAAACDWLWGCRDQPRAYRPAPYAYAYRNGHRQVPRYYGYPAYGYSYYGYPAYGYSYYGYPAYGYTGFYGYGYTNPLRVEGDAYADWPSDLIPPSRWYMSTAPRVPNASAFGLMAPISSQQGLLEAGLPARGPSLFGPEPAPPPVAYSGYYYSAPPYRVRRPYAEAPPPDTASWWLEPRRR